jgi:hypothetical protein
MDKDVSLGISAEDAGLNAAMAAAANAVKTGVAQMNNNLDSMGSTLDRVKGMFSAFTVALAGGTAFKVAVEEAVNLTKESTAMGKALGISATEASVLKLALDDVHLSGEQFQDSNDKLAKQLVKNETAFKNLGVATRDSNGEFRNSVDIQMDVNKRLLEFKEGTDRNVEGIKIYGKGWAEARETLRLTSATMAAAQIKAEALGLSVGQENVEATKRYRAAMNDVHDVISAVMKAVGDALLPMLSQIGEWFSNIGPAAVALTRQAMEIFSEVISSVGAAVQQLWNIASTVFNAIGTLVQAVFGGEGISVMQFFSGVLKAVQVAVIALRVGFETSIEVIRLSLDILMSWLIRFANVAERALHLDFAGAKAAWTQGTADIEAILAASTARMVAISEKGRADIDAAIMGDGKRTFTPVERKGGGLGSAGSDSKGAGKDTSRVNIWEAALQDEKVYYQKSNDLKEFSKQQEKQYWLDILATNNASQQEKLAINRKIAVLELDIMKKSNQDRTALSAEAINAYEKAALDGVNQNELVAKQEVELGRMSKQQLLAVQQDYENQRYDIMVTAQQSRITAMQGDPNMDPVALQKLMDQMGEIHRKHSVDVEKIQYDMQLNVKQQWTNMMFPIKDAFDRTINGMIQGTLTWRRALLNIGDNVVASFAKMGFDMATAWAAAELRKTAATQTNTTIRAFLEKMGLIETSAAQATAAGTSIATAKIEAAAVIPAEAAIAAGGAAAAVAPIPVVGPALAAAAFAETMAMVLSGLAVASAEGGYDIPAGINPVTQLHEKEMVLPAEHAESIRNMTGTGGTVHIHTSGGDFIHKRDLAKLLKQMGRNFAFKPQ